MPVNILKTLKNNFSKQHCRKIRAADVMYRSICRNSFYLWIIVKEKNDHYFVEYGINSKDSFISETHKIDSVKEKYF